MGKVFGIINRAPVVALRATVCAMATLLTTLCTAQTAQELKTQLPAVYALAFSLDGKHLAVGTHGEALLYDTSNWNVSDVCTQVQGAARSFAFHPDGKHLAIGSGAAGVSGNMLMWDISGETHPISYEAAGDTIENIAFSKDGSNMLTASFDNKARFYAVTFYPYTPQRLEEHNGRVTAVSFSTKPKYIFATGSMDKNVKVWDYKSAKVVVNFDQATAGITGVAFLSNGDQLVGSSLDGNLYWWGVSYSERRRFYSGYPIRTIKDHEDGVTAFSYSANFERIATGGVDHRIVVRRMNDGAVVREFKDAATPIYATALSPDGKIVAAAGREGLVWIWDIAANKLLCTLTPPPPSAAKPGPTKAKTLTNQSVPAWTSPVGRWASIK